MNRSSSYEETTSKGRRYNRRYKSEYGSSSNMSLEIDAYTGYGHFSDENNVLPPRRQINVSKTEKKLKKTLSFRLPKSRSLNKSSMASFEMKSKGVPVLGHQQLQSLAMSTKAQKMLGLNENGEDITEKKKTRRRTWFGKM